MISNIITKEEAFAVAMDYKNKGFMCKNCGRIYSAENAFKQKASYCLGCSWWICDECKYFGVDTCGECKVNR